MKISGVMAPEIHVATGSDRQTSAIVRRVIPVVVSFCLALAVLVPAIAVVPVHNDERQYVWTAHYFTSKLLHLDLRTKGTNSYTDPGWAPVDFWPLTQPMGTRFVYGLTMAIFHVPAPALPYSYGDRALQGADTQIPAETLPIVRLASVLCAAVGCALFTIRLGWRGVALTVITLLAPGVRDNVSRALAEGPLLLGFGLCALTYGTRWFAPMCGVAATFKLTALGLWPLTLVRRANGGHHGPLGLPIAALAWTALTPPSWFLLGPFYLLPMLADRIKEYSSLSEQYPGPFGLFFPDRYYLPFVVLLALGIVLVAPRVLKR